MGNISQELVGVLFLGKRVGITGALTDDLNSVGLRVATLKLDKLTLGGRLDQFSFDLETSSGGHLGNLGEVRHRAVNDTLKGSGATSISQLDECEVLASHAHGASPSSNFNDVVEHLLILGC
jgi:hypothetical protein